MTPRIEALVQDRDGQWLSFEDPARVVGADSVGAVGGALTEVERLNRDEGLHAVGFVTYEAGAAFGLSVRAVTSDLPLIWFALFEPAHVRRVERPRARGVYELGSLTPSLSRSEFQMAFQRIKDHLAAGNSYQANLTFKMTGQFTGDARDLFADLVEAQQGRYSTFIRIGEWAVCSASPELFFELDGIAIRTRPMKGTARRGRTMAEDRQQRDALRDSPKQQAENVMIVDMMRNDLGRISEMGSVSVPHLFEVERYPNVWQMTSEITARSIASLEDIFSAIHPSASITGAPKVRTMEILSDLEPAERGVYTGAIGHLPPDGNARFSVAIRTAIVDEQAQSVEFGIGSGIVWDSEPDAEYDECLLKASVLGRRSTPFDLLETLRWSSSEGFVLLERHLDRLSDSGEYFGIVIERDEIRTRLKAAVQGATEPQRVRLLVDRDRAVRVETAAFVAALGDLQIALARRAVDPQDVWLFHKTTNRRAYDDARASRSNVDEVLLWNLSGEVTEATTANVVVELHGERVTPPIGCGLLAGTYRAELISRGEIRERVIKVDDLARTTGIWLVNSVHGWRRAVLVDPQ